MPVHSKADNDKQIAECCDDNADGHQDRDQDSEHHAEGGGPAGGAAVLDSDTVPELLPRPGHDGLGDVLAEVRAQRVQRPVTPA